MQVLEPPLSFEEAFRRLNLTLPDDLSRFEPQLVQLPDSHPFKASMLSAKVMGKPADPTKPDFLLTEMLKPLDEHLEELSVGEHGELVQIRLGRPDDKRVTVLIGTSGTRKTLYTYKLANKDPTLLFVGNHAGNAGSIDMQVMIAEAESYRDQGYVAITEFVEHHMYKAVAFRMRVYEECINKYGKEKFQPRHWAMAQLYPAQIFGNDIFKSFQGMNVNKEARQKVDGLIPFHRIVINDASTVDIKLADFFPSEATRNKPCRSLLAPFVDTLARLSPKLLICGTGFSATNVHEASIGMLKPNVGQALVGIVEYFTEDRVLEMLESWGIPRTHAQEWAPAFVGRPRHAEFLATALTRDPAEQEENVKREIMSTVSRYGSAVGRIRSMEVKSLQRNSSLLSVVREAALGWVLGRQGLLVADAVLAIRYSVASLAEIDGKLCCVVREPLLLEALLTKDPALLFEQHLGTSHGCSFEDYLGLKMPQLVGDISKLLNQQPKVNAKFQREWQFPSLRYTRQLGFRAENGDEAKWLKEALESPTPPNTVCFPGTAMGPDLMVCAHAKDNPNDRLVVLIRATSGEATTSGKATTPEAFQALEHLYCQEEKPAKKAKTAKGLEESRRVVDELLAKHQVVRLVIKPQAESDCEPIEVHGNFVNVVLDKHNRNMLPCLKLGFASIEKEGEEEEE